MFSNKLAVVLCVVGVVKATDDFKVIDSIYRESECTSRGGMCTLAADCPKGHLLEQKGLCPTQTSMGVECCYGLSVKETRCMKRGGDCMPGKRPCAKRLIITEATDCPKYTTCCILVL